MFNDFERLFFLSIFIQMKENTTLVWTGLIDVYSMIQKNLTKTGVVSKLIPIIKKST